MATRRCKGVWDSDKILVRARPDSACTLTVLEGGSCLALREITLENSTAWGEAAAVAKALAAPRRRAKEYMLMLVDEKNGRCD